MKCTRLCIALCCGLNFSTLLGILPVEGEGYYRSEPSTHTSSKSHPLFHEKPRPGGNLEQPSHITAHRLPIDTVSSNQNRIDSQTIIAQPVTDPNAGKLPNQPSNITKADDVLSSIDGETHIIGTPKTPTSTGSLPSNKSSYHEAELDAEFFKRNAHRWIESVRKMFVSDPLNFSDSKNLKRWNDASVSMNTLIHYAYSAEDHHIVVNKDLLLQAQYYRNRIEQRFHAWHAFKKDPKLYNIQTFEALLKTITYPSKESSKLLQEAVEDYRWHQMIIIDRVIEILTPGKKQVTLTTFETAQTLLDQLIDQYKVLEKKRRSIKGFDASYDIKGPLSEFSLDVLKKYKKAIDVAIKSYGK